MHRQQVKEGEAHFKTWCLVENGTDNGIDNGYSLINSINDYVCREKAMVP